MDAENELKRLEGVASTSLYDKGVAPFAMSYCFEVFKRHIRGPRILEMGPAEGLMTEQLIRLNHTLTVLEGSPTFCEMLAGKFPDLVIENSLFEDFAPAHPSIDRSRLCRLAKFRGQRAKSAAFMSLRGRKVLRR